MPDECNFVHFARHPDDKCLMCGKPISEHPEPDMDGVQVHKLNLTKDKCNAEDCEYPIHEDGNPCIYCIFHCRLDDMEEGRMKEFISILLQYNKECWHCTNADYFDKRLYIKYYDRLEVFFREVFG